MTHLTTEELDRAMSVWNRILDLPNVRLAYSDTGWTVPGPQMVPDGELAELIESYDGGLEIQFCAYSDYTGSEYDVANLRYLATTYDFVNTQTIRHGGEQGWVVVGELPVGDDVEDSIARLESFADALDALNDYPILDDDLLGEYELELIREALDEWLGRDIMSDLDGAFDGDAESYVTPERALELYCQYDENVWEFENATSIVNVNHDDAVKHVIDELLAGFTTPFVDPNQTSLF